MQQEQKSQTPKKNEAQKSPSKTLLTEELPAGGLTQEEFEHDGRNVVETEGDSSKG